MVLALVETGEFEVGMVDGMRVRELSRAGEGLMRGASFRLRRRLGVGGLRDTVTCSGESLVGFSGLWSNLFVLWNDAWSCHTRKRQDAVSIGHC